MDIFHELTQKWKFELQFEQNFAQNRTVSVASCKYVEDLKFGKIRLLTLWKGCNLQVKKKRKIIWLNLVGIPVLIFYTFKANLFNLQALRYIYLIDKKGTQKELQFH